ncbi:response regulator [Leptolyngbya sp. NK1-12]|uniref:Response regulator n=1 Tax=Leptolyngbya sp. NK1-12 TaxID=2547451 RepID=A0AA96WAX7_9CYAN|nr:response regulator [Leptolyngbya sp. NK1-12]WNZ21550.1 response regulator [Leptolyngbya sp. NK1-12]
MTKRILIVDDEDDIRDVVQVSLEEFAGWQTLSAASGMEALCLATTEPVDAVLLDISMPDMDGFELCEALQNHPKTQNLPVIVLTAKVLPSDQQRFTQLDVAGVITKPFDPMTIWQQIGAILGWLA